jgi:hypothetical protein
MGGRQMIKGFVIWLLGRYDWLWPLRRQLTWIIMAIGASEK